MIEVHKFILDFQEFTVTAANSCFILEEKP